MADEGQQQDLVSEFISVTGADAETTKFYLETAEWDLQFALSNFFDAAAGEEMQDADEQPFVPPQPSQPLTAETATNTAPSDKSNKKNPRFGTIASFSTDAGQENEDSDEEGQAFYAGGSETSGQQIVGPPRKKKEKSDEMTQNIFDAAKRHGAEVVDRSQEAGDKKKKTSAFRGSGFRLGDTEGVSDAVQTPSSGSQGPPEPVVVNLNFWSNGFSVDDGPLRDMNDPENAEFLDAVKRGEIPRELHRLNRGGEVHVNMTDKRDEEYIKPKEIVKAFTGEGHKLGSPTPKVVSSRTPSSNTSSTQAPKVDDSQPVTNLQIRLADGTRLVAKFNHTNTIGDVRNFVNASRPQMAGRVYVLMTTFPNKELTDETLTLTDANLLNAVVVQRYK
ncbi:NSFL1 cofactor p47 [Paramuricea clavata]|uniref:NSFL1 cofactor p47 n=1 Tax=Paramuricea clavata TaxID=317549 RepID=A0A6S7K2U9_PARCT|nr:NSFL1 cofactor p47 [Paramuricea clavata]